MRAMILGSHMSHQGAPAVEPMGSTGGNATGTSRHSWSAAQLLQPPAVNPWEFSR